MSDLGARPLPTSLDQIDAAWLTRALRTRAPGVTVQAVEVVDVMRGTCSKVRLRLDLDEAARRAGIPELVILKGGFEGHSRDLWYMHQGEVQGYRDVYPVVDLSVPACYFADYDEEQHHGIVILEDLLERDVTFCSALAPETFEQAADRMSAFARFHAQTWDSPEFKPGGRWDWVRPGVPGLREHFDQYLKPEPWQRFVNAPRGAATSVMFHDLPRMIEAFDRLVEIAAPMPQCIIHGDAHPGNLYRNADGTPGFLDSIVSAAPGLREIAYHLAGVLDTADRRRWEGPLIHHYLQELRKNNINTPRFDVAMHQYNIFLFLGYVIFLTNESFYQPESINTAYTARFSQAMIDHDTLEILAPRRTIAPALSTI